MSKMTTTPSWKAYGKRETNAIMKLKLGDVEALKAHAAKFGRSYDSVYQKVKSVTGSTVRPPSNLVKMTKADLRLKDIPAMVFKDVEFDPAHTKVNGDELISMQKGLDLAVVGILNQNKRGILFPNKMVNRAKEYLTKQYPKNVFSFHTSKANKNMVVLVKKV